MTVPTIELERIDELRGFDPEDFAGYPKKYRFASAISDVLEEGAAELAKKVPWVCIAVINDQKFGKFALSRICADGKAERFAFFNAEGCDPVDAEVKIVVDDGTLEKKILCEEYMRYAEGSIF